MSAVTLSSYFAVFPFQESSLYFKLLVSLFARRNDITQTWFFLWSLVGVTEGDGVGAVGSWTQFFSLPTAHRPMVCG